MARKKEATETAKTELEKETKKADIEEEIEQKQKSTAKKYLADLDLYIKTRIYVGHKIITPDMRPYVFRRKADGVAVFNTDIVDEKLRQAIDYLSKFKPQDILVIGKKPQCWKALDKFSEITGIKIFKKKYPAGILTNTNLPNFIEPKLVFIIDPVADKNALHDANIAKIPVLSLCNSNHYTRGIDFVLPINNKEEHALSLTFYLIAKGYLDAIGIRKKVQLDDFLDIKRIGEKESEKNEPKIEKIGKAKDAIKEKTEAIEDNEN